VPKTHTTQANDDERRPANANHDERRPAQANDDKRRPTQANDDKRRPTQANDDEQRPTQAYDGPRQPTTSGTRDADASRVPGMFFFWFFFFFQLHKLLLYLGAKNSHNAGQRRRTKANTGLRRPTTVNAGQHRPTTANEGQRRPTTANDGERRPTQAPQVPKHAYDCSYACFFLFCIFFGCGNACTIARTRVSYLSFIYLASENPPGLETRVRLLVRMFLLFSCPFGLMFLIFL